MVQADLGLVGVEKSPQEEFHEGRPLCPAGGLDVGAEGVERPAQAEGVTMRRDDARCSLGGFRWLCARINSTATSGR